MIYFKLVISSVCLVKKKKERKKTKKSFWCSDIKSKRPALVFTLFTSFLIEKKNSPVYFSHFYCVRCNIGETLQCLWLVIYRFSHSESMWRLQLPRVSARPLFPGTWRGCVFQAASELGVAVGLDTCQWNMSRSDSRNFCLICLKGSPWPATLSLPHLASWNGDGQGSPASQLVLAEPLPAWVSRDWPEQGCPPGWDTYLGLWPGRQINFVVLWVTEFWGSFTYSSLVSSIIPLQKVIL